MNNEESDGESNDASGAHILDYIGGREDQDHDYSGNPEVPEPTENTFDLTLPATHSYLGQNLEELRGRTVLDDGIHINLPLLVMNSVILFPGQTLPLTAFRSRTIDMLQTCIQKDRTFGVVNLGYDIGTTAEIYEYMDGHRALGYRLKAKGRQRFKVLRVIIRDYDKILANVKILPEVTLGPPFFEERLASLDYLRVQPTNQREASRKAKVEKMDAAVTPWPAWIYRQYDPIKLSVRIRQHLQFIENRGSNVPTDPVELSFWVAQNILLDDDERITLLKYDCAIPRLQRVMKYLVQDRVFICANCNSFIANQADVFPMSKEGPQSAFCNPAGVIHETITLYRVSGLNLNDEPPALDYSWFPGYGWTIATCKNCGVHIGWKYTAMLNHLSPLTFWGLTRKSLKNTLIKKNRSPNHDPDYSDFDEEWQSSNSSSNQRSSDEGA